ncbi:hypothetical protein [Plantactinospora sp. DSM 117369]
MTRDLEDQTGPAPVELDGPAGQGLIEIRRRNYNGWVVVGWALLLSLLWVVVEVVGAPTTATVCRSL